MPTRAFPLLLFLILPFTLVAQKQPIVANKIVADSAGQKAAQKATAANTNPAKTPTAQLQGISVDDTLFVYLVRQILILRDKFGTLKGDLGTQKAATKEKADTFGYIKLRSAPPLKVGLYRLNRPYLDSSLLEKAGIKDTSKLSKVQISLEALSKTLPVDSVQLYIKNSYISRTVIFSGSEIYQSHERVDIQDIDDNSTTISFMYASTPIQIRVKDLIIYLPWHDDSDQSVKQDIYLLNSSKQVTLPTQQ